MGGACKPGDRGCHHACGRPFVKLSQKCDSMGESMTCHKSCGMDFMCHHKCPKMKDVLHCDKDHDNHNKERHEKTCEIMKYSKICHMGCGWDRECHQQCPKPFEHLQAKCEMLKPLKACHEKCHHDHACHEACALPEDPKMANKVKDILKCHGACKPGDRECHHACGRPFGKLSQKCDSMGEVKTCHKSCGMDSTCHHKCPKMSDMWHCGQDHDDNHKDHHHHFHHLRREPLVERRIARLPNRRREILSSELRAHRASLATSLVEVARASSASAASRADFSRAESTATFGCLHQAVNSCVAKK